MKDRKRRWKTWLFMIRQPLKTGRRMAEKGWLVEQPGPYFWKYRRIEPKRRSERGLFSKASEFDPSPTEGQIQLEELCKRDGWILAGPLGPDADLL